MTLNQHKKIENNVIIAGLKSETLCKLINRIPVSRLLISSLPVSALRTHVESLANPGSAVRLTSVARHVTDWATWSGQYM